MYLLWDSLRFRRLAPDDKTSELLLLRQQLLVLRRHQKRGPAITPTEKLLLIQMVGTGLQFSLVNLYLQPMVRAFIIFLAIFFDSLREANFKKLKRRFIRPVHRAGPEARAADAGD